MSVEELNDLAFELVEKHDMPTGEQVFEFAREKNISFDYGEYFLVLVKHWIQNKIDLKFADTYLNYHYQVNCILDRKSE